LLQTTRSTVCRHRGDAPARARARAGLFDASLKVRHSVAEPVVGGSVRLSRGVALLQPQAPPAPDGGAAATAREARRLLPAFSALARRDSLSRSLSRLELLQPVRSRRPQSHHSSTLGMLGAVAGLGPRVA